MKQLAKQAISILFIGVFFLGLTTSSAKAAVYGSGRYGEGKYGVGVDVTTQPSSSQDSSSNTTSNLTTPTTPRCEEQTPGAKAPWLYGAIAQNGSSIRIYFTEAGNPVDHYVLQFGDKAGQYIWGANNIGGSGSRTYLVQSLLSNKTYYFKVRGGNGCATGPWSNEISAKTKGLFSFNQLKTTHLELKPGTASGTDSSTQQTSVVNGHTVYVIVNDKDQKPVKGAKVVIHSEIQEKISDEQGRVQFTDVEPGQHQVLISYNNFEGEESIHLNDSNEEYHLTVTVEQKNMITSPLVLAVLAALSLFVIVLIVLLIRSRARKH